MLVVEFCSFFTCFSVNTVLPELELTVDPKLPPPSDLQCKLLRQIVLTGLADRVARKIDVVPGSEDAKKLKWAYQVRACA